MKMTDWVTIVEYFVMICNYKSHCLCPVAGTGIVSSFFYVHRVGHLVKQIVYLQHTSEG